MLRLLLHVLLPLGGHAALPKFFVEAPSGWPTEFDRKGLGYNITANVERSEIYVGWEENSNSLWSVCGVPTRRMPDACPIAPPSGPTPVAPR